MLIGQGWILRTLGRLNESVLHFRSLLARGARDGYDTQRLAATGIQLAASLALMGEVQAAVAEARRALPVLKATMAWPLWGDKFIAVAVGCGQHAVAMQLLGHLGDHTETFDPADRGHLRHASEAACGPPQVAAWLAAGRALDTNGALRLCDQLVGQSPPQPGES